MADFWRRALRALTNGSDGAGFVEYGVMMGVSSIVTVMSISILGTSLDYTFVSTAGRLPSAAVTSGTAVGASTPTSSPSDPSTSGGSGSEPSSSVDTAGNSSGNDGSDGSCGGHGDTHAENNHSGSESEHGEDDDHDEDSHGDDGHGDTQDDGGHHAGHDR